MGIIGRTLFEPHPNGDGVRTRIQGDVERITAAIEIGKACVHVGIIGRVCSHGSTGIQTAGGHGAIGYDAKDG